MNKKLNLILRAIHYTAHSDQLLMGDDIMIQKFDKKRSPSFTITKIYKDICEKNPDFAERILSGMNDNYRQLNDININFTLNEDEIEKIILELFDITKYSPENVQDYSDVFRPTSKFTIYLDDWIEIIKYSDNTLVVRLH